MNEILTIKAMIESLCLDLVFNEGNHTYTLRDVILPSVTQIMKPLSDEVYSHIDPEVLRFAAQRGTDVHFATELYDLYGVIDIRPELMPYLEAYIQWKQDYQPEIITVEKRLYHKHLFYAGTIDRLAIINDKIVLVDLKSTRALETELVSVQDSAYRDMFISHNVRIDAQAVLQLKPDGTYVYKELDDALDIFAALYKIHNFKMKIKRKGV
jgi:hypothetical protein